jgi:hypothetical protein
MYTAVLNPYAAIFSVPSSVDVRHDAHAEHSPVIFFPAAIKKIQSANEYCTAVLVAVAIPTGDCRQGRFAPWLPCGITLQSASPLLTNAYCATDSYGMCEPSWVLRGGDLGHLLYPQTHNSRHGVRIGARDGGKGDNKCLHITRKLDR